MKSPLAILASVTGTALRDWNLLAYHVAIAVEAFAAGVLAPPQQDCSERHDSEP